MERLTKREGKHTIRVGNEWRRHDPVWDKLAYYEDLEEEGKLITLPCKIGDTVYRVQKMKYDVDGYGMQWVEDWGIVTYPFRLEMFNEIGKITFLTREEAKVELNKKYGL